MTSEREREKLYRTAKYSVQPLIDVYIQDPPNSVREKAVAEKAIWDSLSKEYRSEITAMDGFFAKWVAYVLNITNRTTIRARGRALQEEREGYNVDAAWLALEDPEIAPNRVYRAFAPTISEVAKLEQDLAPKGLESSYVLKAKQKCFEEALRRHIADPPKDVDPDLQPKSRKKKPKEPTFNRTRETKEAWSTIWDQIQNTINEQVRPILQSRLEDLETEHEINLRLNALRAEMHACFQDFFLGVNRVQHTPNGKDILEEKRETVKHHLDVLRINPPRGWTKETLDKAAIKSAYKKRSVRFHPDSNGGDPRFVELYNQLQESYRFLKNYLNL